MNAPLTLVLYRPAQIKPGDAKKLNLRVSPGRPYANLVASRFLTEIAAALPDAVAGESGPVVLQSATRS